MNRMDILDIIQAIWKFRSNEGGQALGEYSLVLGLIAIVCVLALTAIGAAVVIPFGDLIAVIGVGG